MATIDLGKIKPLYKGIYQSNTSFEPLDFTIFADVLYINKQACSGIEPTDTAYFDPVNISSNGLLTLLKQVDGHLSGLDADTVDGKHAEELQDKITGAASTITAADLPENIVLISTAEGKVTASTITAEELFLLQGATLNIQQQLNYKQATITGAASSVTTSNLSPSMVVVTTPDGKIAASATISAAELSYLEGVTSAIQTQLDSKLGLLDLSNYLEKVLVSPNTVLVANADGKATSSSISTTTLGYLNGLTGNIQSQLDLAATNLDLVATNVVYKTGDQTITGNVTLAGNRSNFGLYESNSNIEVGLSATYPHIDFHCSNTPVDYNARIACGGASKGLGGGDLQLLADGPGGSILLSTPNTTIKGWVLNIDNSVVSIGGANIINWVKSPNGYLVLHGGFILQWGSGTYGAGAYVTFPVSFANACVYVNWEYEVGGLGNIPRILNRSKTGFSMATDACCINDMNTQPKLWFAIGY